MTLPRASSLLAGIRCGGVWPIGRMLVAALTLMFALAAAGAPPVHPGASRRQPPVPRSAAARLPQLGDEVPAALLKRSPRARSCETGEDRHEPCATVSIDGERITLAWDDATRRITYLYSSTLATDNDLRAGDMLPIDGEVPVTPFGILSIPHRFVSSDWCDTDRALSGDVLWCAVMVPARPRSGKVLGFVQSLYLYLPDIDGAPIHRIAQTRRAPHGRRLRRCCGGLRLLVQR